MAKTKQKPKLTAIPAYKGKTKSRAATRKVADCAGATSDVAPDLSHIAEQLRPLAVPVGYLQFDPANAMTHPEANIDAIKGSLEVYGQRKPVVVNRRTHIVEAGNGTLKAALSLNWSHIAAVFVDDDPAKAAGFAITDNRSAQLAEWDKDALDKLMRDMDTGNDERLDAMMASLAADVGIVEQEASDGGQQPARQQGESFQVIVECETAESQSELHERLKGEGYKCKALQT